MILSKEKKIGVFCIPKTGSSTLTSLFANVQLHQNINTHINYADLVNKINSGKINITLEELDSYKFYAFYRDPVDRFKSAYNYILNFCTGSTLLFLPLSQTEITSVKNNLKEIIQSTNKQIGNIAFNDLNDISKNIVIDAGVQKVVETLETDFDTFYPAKNNLKDFMEELQQNIANPPPLPTPPVKPKTPPGVSLHAIQSEDRSNATNNASSQYPRVAGLGAIPLGKFIGPQKYWLDFDIDFTYLKFSDYDNEVRKLLTAFNLDPNSTIPTLNESVYSYNFTPADLTYIESRCQEDYAFLASKGLSI